MVLNSKESLKIAAEVHERFGNWEAVRKALEDRHERVSEPLSFD